MTYKNWKVLKNTVLYEFVTLKLGKNLRVNNLSALFINFWWNNLENGFIKNGLTMQFSTNCSWEMCYFHRDILCFMQENQSTPSNLNPYFFTKNRVEKYQTNKEEDKAKKKRIGKHFHYNQWKACEKVF